MTASTSTTGVAHREASGNSSRQNRIIPKVPILSRMLTSSTEVPGLRLLGGVGQPGVHRHHRRLDREGDEEADEQPAPGVRGRSSIWLSSVRRYVGPPAVRPTRRRGRRPRPA